MKSRGVAKREHLVPRVVAIGRNNIVDWIK